MMQVYFLGQVSIKLANSRVFLYASLGVHGFSTIYLGWLWLPFIPLACDFPPWPKPYYIEDSIHHEIAKRKRCGWEPFRDSEKKIWYELLDKTKFNLLDYLIMQSCMGNAIMWATSNEWSHTSNDEQNSSATRVPHFW